MNNTPSIGSQWRRTLADQIAPAYAQNDQVAAVAIGGSVSRGYADRYSDIEINTFWHRPPSEAERTHLAQAAGGDIWHVFPYDEAMHSWSEDYYVKGVKIDAVHRTVDTVHEFFSALVDQSDTTLIKQKVAADIQDGVALYGHAFFSGWQERVDNYPEPLAYAMVDEYLQFLPCWGPEALAERETLLALYERIVQIENNLAMVLLGLNRMYYPGLKWLDRVFDAMPLKPHDVAARFQQVFRLEPQAGVQQLQALIEDTFALVERHMPTLDIQARKAFYKHRRTIFDQPPEGLT